MEKSSVAARDVRVCESDKQCISHVACRMSFVVAIKGMAISTSQNDYNLESLYISPFNNFVGNKIVESFKLRIHSTQTQHVGKGDIACNRIWIFSRTELSAVFLS